MTDVKEVR